MHLVKLYKFLLVNNYRCTYCGIKCNICGFSISINRLKDHLYSIKDPTLFPNISLRCDLLEVYGYF